MSQPPTLSERRVNVHPLRIHRIVLRHNRYRFGETTFLQELRNETWRRLSWPGTTITSNAPTAARRYKGRDASPNSIGTDQLRRKRCVEGQRHKSDLPLVAAKFPGEGLLARCEECFHFVRREGGVAEADQTRRLPIFIRPNGEIGMPMAVERMAMTLLASLHILRKEILPRDFRVSMALIATMRSQANTNRVHSATNGQGRWVRRLVA